MKPPFTVTEFIEAARAAHHDSFGIANDVEALETLEQLACRQFVAMPSQENLERWLSIVVDIVEISFRNVAEC